MKKRIILLGDSIRLLGYGERVANALAEDFSVWQPEDNCRGVKYTLRELFRWATQIEGSDIIHWNNGLWDVCNLFGNGPATPINDYVEDMLHLAALLKKRTRVLIFATTTPVREENPHNKNSDIVAYNAALIPHLERVGVRINDLYTPVSQDIPRYIRGDDLVHLSEEGAALCADLVERAIRDAAAIPSESTAQLQTPTSAEPGAPI